MAHAPLTNMYTLATNIFRSTTISSIIDGLKHSDTDSGIMARKFPLQGSSGSLEKTSLEFITANDSDYARSALDAPGCESDLRRLQ